MAKFNRKGSDSRIDRSAKPVAGGMGAPAAAQDYEALLRRAVMSCLLWENTFYQSGEHGAAVIEELVPKVAPDKVAQIAIEAREVQKLRHVPLWLIVQMLKYDAHRKLVSYVIPRVITRADQITDLVALYFKSRGKRQRPKGQKHDPSKLPRQMRYGLDAAFSKFNAYHFAKYDQPKAEVKFRDVLRIVHPKPSEDRAELYGMIKNGTLPVPDTWENALMRGEDKRATWERLISERKLGNLAFLRNLRGMLEAGVSGDIFRLGFSQIKDAGLTPFNFLAAQTAAPQYAGEIEEAMFRAFASLQKLPGWSVFVVDVSGSMDSPMSTKSEFSRLNAAAAMAVLAREMCERVTLYATAGSDGTRIHKTQVLPNYRGFGLIEQIMKAKAKLGGGGIFTRQALEHINAELKGATPDRIIVFSDSQDCDIHNPIPKPFGGRNYIVDVSSEARGINYAGLWTAEISGFSEHFLRFIAGLEGVNLPETSDETEQQ